MSGTEVVMARKEITVKLYYGGQEVERLTEEQCDRMMQRLSEAMSNYYTAHPEEFEILKKNSNANT